MSSKISIVCSENIELPLFSVVILSYEKQPLLLNAIRSVLIQDYAKIQLVISDDGSSDFDEEEVRSFCARLNGSRFSPLEDFQIVRSSVNTGTVRNLYRGYEICRGKYVTQIAGDDQFHDNRALSNYAAALAQVPSDVCGVYGVVYRCDENLAYQNAGEVIDAKFAYQLNFFPAEQQYGQLCSYCHFHLGGTAFIKSILDQIPSFSDRYVMLEDWPLFIRATHMGWRFIYIHEPILDYRQGGVSQNDTVTQAKIQCFIDTKKLFESEVIPNCGILSPKDFFEMAVHFDYLKTQISPVAPDDRYFPRFLYFGYNLRGAFFYFSKKLICFQKIHYFFARSPLRVILDSILVMLSIVGVRFSPLFFICFFVCAVFVDSEFYKMIIGCFIADIFFLFSRK